MRNLIEMLYTIEDVKKLEPYKWQTGDVICLEMRIEHTAASVRERVLRHAFRMLAS